jgi:hypothetical protein
MVFGLSPAPRRLQAQNAEPSLSPPPQDAAITIEVEGQSLPALVMMVGGGPRFRSIALDVGDGTGGTENRSFDTGAYFDFGWHLLIRPWGRRSPRPAMQAMLLQLDGGAGIGLTAEPAGTGISLQTNTWRLLGQLGYLYPRGPLQVGGLAGVGVDTLTIDLNSVLPSSKIIYVRFGPAVIYNLVPDFLGLRADFGFRFPFTLGDLEDAFGDDSSAFGLDAAFTLGGQLKAGFAYALRVAWEHYRLHFAGRTTNVPSMGDGGRGTDHAITIQFLVGWSL